MAMGGLEQRPGPKWLHVVPRWIREIALIAVIYLVYELCRGLQSGGFAVARRNGWDILHWERAVDLDPEHLLTHALISVTPLAVAAAYFYATMHYVITPVVLVWMYRCHALQYRTARTSLAISTLIGLVIFYFVPTAPPRLLRGAGVPDALFDVRNWGWWGGDGSVPRGLGSVTNQVAAMPSLHVGWALWCGFLIYRYASRTWVRALGVAYPLVTALVVLSTGNHYLFDALAGALVMVIGGLLAIFFSHAHRRFVAHHATRHSRIARDAGELARAATTSAATTSASETAADAPPPVTQPRSPAEVARACLRR
jgi:hypothetical protein